MRKRVRSVFFITAVLLVGQIRGTIAQSTNLPPKVSILWPTEDGCLYNRVFSPGAFLKIKVDASDPDGSIAQVQFFSPLGLIGVSSNAPFSMVWEHAGPPRGGSLKAVAVDNLGATTESAIVFTYFAEQQLPPVFAVTSPVPGSVFAAPGTFEFSAELLSSPQGDTGPVQFFVGTNLVGTVTQSGPFTVETPPYSLTVTNVPEGSYELSVTKDGLYSGPWCRSSNIRVTKLGIKSSTLRPDNRFEFDVVTSFPTNQNVIEASSNLLNWTAISTNVPMTNRFTFTEPSPASNSPRFYRAVVPFQ